MAARWATAPRSMTSWGEEDASREKPVDRTPMTSEWSLMMDRAWAERGRAETWNTPGSISPAILYMLGIISSSRPWEAV